MLWFDHAQARDQTELKVALGASAQFLFSWKIRPSPHTRVAVLTKSMDCIEARHNRWLVQQGHLTDDRRSLLLRSRATCRKLLLPSVCSWSKGWHLSHPNNHLPAVSDVPLRLLEPFISFIFLGDEYRWMRISALHLLKNFHYQDTTSNKSSHSLRLAFSARYQCTR